MKFVVKTFEDKKIVVEVDPEDSVLTVKSHLQHSVEIPLKLMRLVFNRQELEDDSASLAQSGITEGSIVYLVLPLKGDSRWLS